jgi:hypothetical protein
VIWSDDITIKIIQIFDHGLIEYNIPIPRKDMKIFRYFGNGKYCMYESGHYFNNIPDRLYIITLTIGDDSAKIASSLQVEDTLSVYDVKVINTTAGEFIIHTKDRRLYVYKGNGYDYTITNNIEPEFTVEENPISFNLWWDEHAKTLTPLKTFNVHGYESLHCSRSWFSGKEILYINTSILYILFDAVTTSEVTDDLYCAILQIDVVTFTPHIGYNLLQRVETINDRYCIGNINYDFAVREIRNNKGKIIKIYPFQGGFNYVTSRHNIAYFIMNRLTETEKPIIVQINFP